MTRPTRATSPAATTGRWASSTPSALGLDGALPRRDRRARQPAAGPVARLQPGARAGHDEDAGGGGLLAGGLQHVGLRSGRTAHRPGACRRSASWARSTRPRRPMRRRAARRWTRASCSTRWPRSWPRRASRRTPHRSLPDGGGEFPARLAALAAMLGAGLPIKCASLTAVGSYDTHSDEPDTLSTNLGADDRIGARVPARPRSPRARRPRADPAVVGVRPPPAGKRLGHRPRRRRRGVPDRHPRRRAK